ncbi:hypothetical protein TNCV_388501 [Trichonephila clavipes]|nr:hypothetical protein TNCV_388501 [Trichonephila clavipes]
MEWHMPHPHRSDVDHSASSRSWHNTIKHILRFIPCLPMVCRGLLFYRLHARILLGRIFLTLKHQILKMQWTCQYSQLSDDSHCNMDYNDGPILAKSYRDERFLHCIILNNTG